MGATQAGQIHGGLNTKRQEKLNIKTKKLFPHKMLIKI